MIGTTLAGLAMLGGALKMSDTMAYAKSDIDFGTKSVRFGGKESCRDAVAAYGGAMYKLGQSDKEKSSAAHSRIFDEAQHLRLNIQMVCIR